MFATTRVQRGTTELGATRAIALDFRKHFDHFDFRRIEAAFCCRETIWSASDPRTIIEGLRLAIGFSILYSL